jgi:hypothetical protein
MDCRLGMNYATGLEISLWLGLREQIPDSSLERSIRKSIESNVQISKGERSIEIFRVAVCLTLRFCILHQLWDVP